MWQLARVVSQLVCLMTDLTPAKEVLLTPVDEACACLSRINERSLAACAQPVDIITANNCRLTFRCLVEVVRFVTADTFFVDVTCDAVWVMRGAFVVCGELVVLCATGTAFLGDFETIFNCAEPVDGELE